MREILRVSVVSCFFVGIDDLDNFLEYGVSAKLQTMSRLSFSMGI